MKVRTAVRAAQASPSLRVVPSTAVTGTAPRSAAEIVGAAAPAALFVVMAGIVLRAELRGEVLQAHLALGRLVHLAPAAHLLDVRKLRVDQALRDRSGLRAG